MKTNPQIKKPVTVCRIPNTRWGIDRYGRVYDMSKNVLEPFSALLTSNEGYKYLISGTERIWLHRWVAYHFIPRPENWRELVVDHKDGRRTNNCFKNLQWITQSQNIKLIAVRKKKKLD